MTEDEAQQRAQEAASHNLQLTDRRLGYWLNFMSRDGRYAAMQGCKERYMSRDGRAENCSLHFLDILFPTMSTSSFPGLVHFTGNTTRTSCGRSYAAMQGCKERYGEALMKHGITRTANRLREESV